MTLHRRRPDPWPAVIESVGRLAGSVEDLRRSSGLPTEVGVREELRSLADRSDRTQDESEEALLSIIERLQDLIEEAFERKPKMSPDDRERLVGEIAKMRRNVRKLFVRHRRRRR
ncbi:MAG: hypothetical protein HYY17_13765 [Planctomycetes bacterium]|nr:hypothetical protein [Planctomycetota bacterium]